MELDRWATLLICTAKQRNTKEENEAIKTGETPGGWEEQPAKNAQKDKDARWTKRNEESFYGYKNHLGKIHKLIRKWDATDASVRDSQKLDDEHVSGTRWAARPCARSVSCGRDSRSG